MKFISRKNLTKRRDISLSTQKRLEKQDPRHPKPVDMSPGRNGRGRQAFVEPEVDEYDLLLIAERDNALAKDGENKPAEEAEANAASQSSSRIHSTAKSAQKKSTAAVGPGKVSVPEAAPA